MVPIPIVEYGNTSLTAFRSSAALRRRSAAKVENARLRIFDHSVENNGAGEGEETGYRSPAASRGEVDFTVCASEAARGSDRTVPAIALEKAALHLNWCRYVRARTTSAGFPARSVSAPAHVRICRAQSGHALGGLGAFCFPRASGRSTANGSRVLPPISSARTTSSRSAARYPRAAGPSARSIASRSTKRGSDAIPCRRRQQQTSHGPRNWRGDAARDWRGRT